MNEFKANALSAAERHRLSATYDHAMATMPKFESAGRRLADMLRGKLPDVDDVTMGRVALALGEFIGGVADDDHQMLVLTNQVVMAGLDLTALEWRGAPGE